MVVTERCVFGLTPDGIKLVEITKGIDLEKDTLAQMEFTPLIEENLMITDTCIYRDGVCGNHAFIQGKE